LTSNIYCHFWYIRLYWSVNWRHTLTQTW